MARIPAIGGSLVLVGSGGLTRETLELIVEANRLGAGWQIEGILDDAGERHGCTVHGVTVVGAPGDYAVLAPGARLVLCTGSPRNYASRKTLEERLGLPRDRYATLLHPAAQLAASTEVGNGTIVLAGVIATADVRLGAHVVVMPATVLTHDDVVEDFVTIASGVRLSGGVRVGAGAYIGAGAVVREGVTIGPGALVGMGSVVLDDVPDGAVWAGCPAQPLRSDQPSRSRTTETISST